MKFLACCLYRVPIPYPAPGQDLPQASDFPIHILKVCFESQARTLWTKVFLLLSSQCREIRFWWNRWSRTESWDVYSPLWGRCEEVERERDISWVPPHKNTFCEKFGNRSRETNLQMTSGLFYFSLSWSLICLVWIPRDPLQWRNLKGMTFMSDY
jgi:hypothetical protein